MTTRPAGPFTALLCSRKTLLAAEVQQENAQHFAGPQPADKLRTLEETGGIPTGLAPDIQKHIETRRANLAKAAAVDNLEKVFKKK